MAKTKQSNESTAAPRLGLGRVALGGLALGIAALVGRYAARRRSGGSGAGEHAAPDLALDQPHPGPDHRAPQAFRPDPTAPVAESEREALRPATAPKPRLVAGSDVGEARAPAGG